MLIEATKKVDLPQGGRYRAEKRADGSWDLRDVAVYVADDELGRDWCEKAVARAKERHEQDGYLGPAHVNHHFLQGPPDPARDAKVEGAGYFFPHSVRDGLYEGKPAAIVYADLLGVPEGVFQRLEARRLPYASVEALNTKVPEFHSLALMEHRVPRKKLPLLTVGEKHVPSLNAEIPEEPVDLGSILIAAAEAPMPKNETKGTPAKNGDPAQGQPAPGATPPAGQAPDANNGAPVALVAGPSSLETALTSIAGSLKDLAANQGANFDLIRSRLGIENKSSEAVKPVEQPKEAALAASQGQAATAHGAEGYVSAKAFAELAATVRGISDRLAASDERAAAERAVDEVAAELQKAGILVDADYRGQLRAFAEQGADVLKAHVSTRKAFGPQDPPTAFTGDMRPSRVSINAELADYAKRGPAVLSEAKRLAAEYEAAPASIREQFKLKEWIDGSFGLEAGRNGK